MKTALLSFATLAALTATAAAESQTSNELSIGKDGYVGIGTELSTHRELKLGAMLDGGLRLGDSPLFAHARYTRGGSGGQGRYDQARVGLEARSCAAGGWTCAFAGLDLGYQYDHVIATDFCIKGDNGGGCEGAHKDYTAHDFLAVPRVGVEIGKRFKLRLGIEVPVVTRLDMEERSRAVVLTAGFGYSW